MTDSSDVTASADAGTPAPAAPAAADIDAPTGGPAILASNAALPRYVQISEMLIREIAAGRLPHGARLPPEREMAATLDTSVGTLRKALADLVDKGLLDRRQGSGNYIRHAAVHDSVYAFFRLERIGGGGLPTAQVLNVARLPKPAEAPSFGPSALGHRIRRLRHLDGTVVALEEIWLDARHASDIALHDLSESLYFFYRRDLNLVISRVEDRLGVTPVPDWSPPEFAPAAGSAVGHVERLGWDQRGEAAEYSRTWFDSDKARYVSRMGKG